MATQMPQIRQWSSSGHLVSLNRQQPAAAEPIPPKLFRSDEAGVSMFRAV